MCVLFGTWNDDTHAFILDRQKTSWSLQVVPYSHHPPSESPVQPSLAPNHSSPTKHTANHHPPPPPAALQRKAPPTHRLAGGFLLSASLSFCASISAASSYLWPPSAQSPAVVSHTADSESNHPANHPQQRRNRCAGEKRMSV